MGAVKGLPNHEKAPAVTDHFKRARHRTGAAAHEIVRGPAAAPGRIDADPARTRPLAIADLAGHDAPFTARAGNDGLADAVAAFVDQLERHLARIRQPAVAELHQRHERRIEIDTGSGQLVFDAARCVGIAHFREECPRASGAAAGPVSVARDISRPERNSSKRFAPKKASRITRKAHASERMPTVLAIEQRLSVSLDDFFPAPTGGAAFSGFAGLFSFVCNCQPYHSSRPIALQRSLMQSISERQIPSRNLDAYGGLVKTGCRKCYIAALFARAARSYGKSAPA